jgi:hypothetical protein
VKHLVLFAPVRRPAKSGLPAFTPTTMSFRKIDIDIYDEDVLLDTELYEPDPRDPAQALADAKQKQAVVRSTLAKYSHISRLCIMIQPKHCSFA